MYSVEQVKAIGKERTSESFSLLLEIFGSSTDIDIRREAVSSIGRHTDNSRIYDFISREAFKKDNPMELIYQMFRTCLYKSREDERFSHLRRRIIETYHNEVIDKMDSYYMFRQGREKLQPRTGITSPILLVGDCEQTLSQLPGESVQLVFTSPPYYNAREYSDYSSYADYLAKMGRVFSECSRVLEAGRFMIVNVSPVITKRPGREFESIRYPIHYDFHRVLSESGYYFIDEIIWIKPEPSVPDRISGYKQTRKPLSYKPNCITESIMIYRKNCPFLLDRNMKAYGEYDRHDEEEIDTSNCWYIAPKYDKNHPAVFPEELCRRILRYYSFEGDAVLDPFAGSGTFGRVARRMGRLPVLCEMNEDYAEIIDSEAEGYYDVRGRNNPKHCQQITIGL
ncbi:MAG: site-specific DNA-methyltransferase [Synergistaceae bacterium]|nr:site-specific DNA-methyltransferase [Synergistaceae bacterium]